VLLRDGRRAVVLELTARETRLGDLPDRFRRSHRIEGARDELRRACPIGVVGGFRLEQFGMREDDPELIIQAVEEQPQVRIDSRTTSRAARLRPA
jgi:hypothetical protein